MAVASKETVNDICSSISTGIKGDKVKHGKMWIKYMITQAICALSNVLLRISKMSMLLKWMMIFWIWMGVININLTVLNEEMRYDASLKLDVKKQEATVERFYFVTENQEWRSC